MKITLNEQKIKKILLETHKPEHDFSVVLKNEKPKTKIGCYKRSISQIVIFLPYFDDNRKLIHTALHEYAHHLSRYGHGCDFFNNFFNLLEAADKKGLHSLNIETNYELKQITDFILKNNLIHNKMINNDYGWLINKAYDICKENEIDFQYYTARILGIPWLKGHYPRSYYKSFCRRVLL